jgi:lantibiotic modifying enzyme
MNASGQEQHLVLKSTDSSSHKIFSTISSRICELLSIEKITEEIKYEGEDIFARDFSAIKHRFSEKEAQDYFFSYGVLISIANLLQMTDLHFENVIASHSGPSVIDAETIFANASIGSPKWSYRNSELLLSKTSPLSQIASRRFIGANLKELNHADKLFVEYSAFKSIDGSLLMNNEGHLISVEKYLRYLNMGAKAADEAIRKNLKNITDIIYCFSSRPHKYRVIMMPTSYYKVLQLRLWNPGISLSFDSRIAETRSKLVKMHALLRHKGDVSNIVNSEMSALLRGDIPFFYINGNTGDLQDTSNIVYSGFALKSSLLSKNIINKYLNKSERKEIDERFLEWMH